MFDTNSPEVIAFITRLRALAVAEAQGICGYEYEMQQGPRYIRVVAHPTINGKRPSLSGSAHSFIDRSTGAVLKSASWKSPAKGVRSYITSPDNGMSGVSVYGAVYHN